MIVTPTAAIFTIVDKVKSNATTRETLTESARSMRLKSMAQAKQAGTRTLIQNGLSGGKIRMVI